MYSTFARTHQAFGIALLITVVLAFLPHRFLGWTRDFAAIVRVPTMPFSHLGIKLGNWVRPPEIITSDVPEEAREYVDHLTMELEKFKQLYIAEQLEVASLRETLEQIQRIPTESRLPARLINADIAARTPSDLFAAVQLNRGSNADITSGTIALYNGVHLVGRVSDVSLLSSTLLPLANTSTGLMLGMVYLDDDRAREDPALIQLEPLGDGNFVADIEAAFGVLVGDTVVLAADPTWPLTARGVTIGVISFIEPIEEHPLRQRLIITPRFHVHQLSRVTLKIEEAGENLAYESGFDGGGEP